MKKRFLLATIILLIIFGLTFAWYIVRVVLTKRFIANYRPPPVAVSTIMATQKTWNPTLKSVGTLLAVQGVDVNSEVPGQIVKIYFKSGQHVKDGNPLVQLDDLVDQQTLQNHLAGLRLDKVNYKRQSRLYRTNATAKSTLDQAQAKMLQSQAQVTTAQVMIQKKKIKAPFNGQLGIRKVNLGQYLSPGETIVTLQALNPLFVDFSLPEQNLRQVHVGQALTITTDAFPGVTFDGKVTAVSSLVDVSTRSLSVRAKIPNADERLYPGLFANVSVILPQQKNVITVPQTAITYSLYGDSLYVVTKSKNKKTKKTDLIATQKFVTLGERKGIVVAVKKGIKPGDVVVTSGQLKLQTGDRVIINNSIKLN